MKKYIIELLKSWLKKLEPKLTETPIIQEQERIFIRNGRQKKRTLCPVMNKVNYDETYAKFKAKASKGIKLRAYHCEFCPNWHLTHKKDKKNFH